MMKKFSATCLCFCCICLHAQISISTNPNDYVPHPNSILDVKSTQPAKAVLLPRVAQISDAINPSGDEAFKGALVYSKENASVYEHNGTKWVSTYESLIEAKSQNLAHFSNTTSLKLACNSYVGCTIENLVLPLGNSDSSDFLGAGVNLSLNSNVITINEAAVYRIAYKSYANLEGVVLKILLKLQRATATAPNNFNDIESQVVTKDAIDLGYAAVFNGSTVIRLEVGDRIRLAGFMRGGATVFSGPVSSATFGYSNANGKGELIFEKIIL